MVYRSAITAELENHHRSAFLAKTTGPTWVFVVAPQMPAQFREVAVHIGGLSSSEFNLLVEVFFFSGVFGHLLRTPVAFRCIDLGLRLFYFGLRRRFRFGLWLGFRLRHNFWLWLWLGVRVGVWGGVGVCLVGQGGQGQGKGGRGG